MNIRIRKTKKTKKPKRRKKTSRKVFKPVAPKASRVEAGIQDEDKPPKLVVMAEFTHRESDSSTIFVCTSPMAALKKAIFHITTSNELTGLRDLTTDEADDFLKAVHNEDYDTALTLWNGAQERRGSTGANSYSVEIWSASIHDEEASAKLSLAAERAWRQRIATQSEATA